jgi:exodeoxyribonuclease VII small subunit
MKKEMNYIEAFEKLEELLQQIERGDVRIDKLPEIVKQANELMEICEGRLRGIEEKVKEATESVTKRSK